MTEGFLAWIKTIFILIWIDIYSIPNRIKRLWHVMVGHYYGFIDRKVYKEKNMFFMVLLLPIALTRLGIDYFWACRKNLTLDEYNKQRTVAQETEIDILKHEVRGRELELMKEYGRMSLSLNDFNEDLARPPFLSPRYLANEVLRLMQGMSNFLFGNRG